MYTGRPSWSSTGDTSMAAANLHADNAGDGRGNWLGQHDRLFEHLMPDVHNHPAQPRCDVSEHDFLSTRAPSRAPSQRSTMADTAQGQQPKRRTHRKLILCFDGTGNKFHGDDSDSNILKIFRMLDRTANDQCKSWKPWTPRIVRKGLTWALDHYYQRRRAPDGEVRNLQI